MPCFNAQETLQEAVLSIATQNLPWEYEIIIVDDGSTDNSREIIKKLEGENKKIKFFFHSKNLGGGAARNTAVANSSGELIFCLDTDDILPKEMLPKMVDFLLHKNVDGVVIGKSVFFTENTNDIKFEVTYKERLLAFTDLFSKESISITGNFLYTRKAFDKIGGYPVAHGFDTQGFGHRFLANNLKAQVMKDAFYYQRLPKQESYYIREVKAGNISKNWLYIYLDNFYKLSPNIKELVINYPYSDFDFNNSETNLPNTVLNSSKIYNESMLEVDYQTAQNLLINSEDKYDHLWLAIRALNLANYQLMMEHSKRALELGCSPWILFQLSLTPFYSSGSFKYESGLFNQLDFFSKRSRNNKEKFFSIASRAKNKLKRNLSFKK